MKLCYNVNYIVLLDKEGMMIEGNNLGITSLNRYISDGVLDVSERQEIQDAYDEVITEEQFDILAQFEGNIFDFDVDDDPSNGGVEIVLLNLVNCNQYSCPLKQILMKINN